MKEGSTQREERAAEEKSNENQKSMGTKQEKGPLGVETINECRLPREQPKKKVKRRGEANLKRSAPRVVKTLHGQPAHPLKAGGGRVIMRRQ